MILLDSSVLIELFRKQKKENTLFYRLTEDETNFCISSITHYEVGIGNQTSSEEYWNELYENLTVIPFDKACSQTAIEIYLELKKSNKLIDLADLLIGATAVTHGYKMATLNRKHFDRIPNIQIL